ncbi:MAG: protein phosphatase 2C domain-containing protein [Pseudomonadota bacterium]
MMEWESASITHEGNRRDHNEDAVFCSSARGLWAVADGMGGHNAGEYASERIAQCLDQVHLEADLSVCVDRIEDALIEVNTHLREHSMLECGGQTVGSTVVAVVTRGHLGVVLWAGDSRLYRQRGHSITLVTRDHNPIADLLDSGGVTEDQAIHGDTHIITRAVGGQLDLHLDVAVFDVAPGDTLLLCSDGLYRELSVDEIQACMAMEVDNAVEHLLQQVLEGEARDNVSAVLTRALAS